MRLAGWRTRRWLVGMRRARRTVGLGRPTGGWVWVINCERSVGSVRRQSWSWRRSSAEGWLSKVRIFEGWCENGDRLLQVVRVQGRPLALVQAAGPGFDRLHQIRPLGAGLHFRSPIPLASRMAGSELGGEPQHDSRPARLAGSIDRPRPAGAERPSASTRGCLFPLGVAARAGERWSPPSVSSRRPYGSRWAPGAAANRYTMRQEPAG